MFKREALWLALRLAGYSDKELGVVANIGSSTDHFRTVEQPWIDETLFAPLRSRGIPVTHIDLKAAKGVDLTVNIMEDEGFETVKALKPNTALLCNILEHVHEPALLTQRAIDVLQPGGRLIVTVPRSYPHHRDPFDTMFRPTPEEVAALVPGVELEHGAIRPTGYHWHDIWRNPRKLQRKRAYWLFKPYLVTFAVLKKPDAKPARKAKDAALAA